MRAKKKYTFETSQTEKKAPGYWRGYEQEDDGEKKQQETPKH
jgi:hypothetical protein